MPTMRNNAPTYAGAANYGYEFDEWPQSWEMKQKIDRPIDKLKGDGLVPIGGNTNLSRDNVKDITALSYEPYETGVGCAEHDDPSCLCDVVIVSPTPINCGAADYEWAEVPRGPLGSYGWWCGILGHHTVKTTLEKMATHGDGLGRIKGRFPDGFDLLAYALDLDDHERLSHKAVSERHGIGRGQVEHHRRRMLNKYRYKVSGRKSGDSGLWCGAGENDQES